MPRADAKAIKAILITLLVADAVLIVAHIGLRGPYLSGQSEFIARLYGRFDLFSDTGIPETFNYTKWVMAAVLSSVAVLLMRRGALAGVTLASLFFLADDAGQLHERVGLAMGAVPIPDPFDIGEGNMWEIVAFAGLGICVAAALFATWWKGGAPGRAVIPMLFSAIVGMAVCGVFADGFAMVFFDPDAVNIAYEAVSVFEDGGELVFISLYCAATFRLLLLALRDAA
jgi:hypothetical protein